jgi:hypothetical protein
MNDKEFNYYLNKFNDRYIVTSDDDNVKVIAGKIGKISSYDPENQLLGCWCINLTKRFKNAILKRLNDVFIEVHQDCDCEFGAYFHEKHIKAVASVIKARKRRNLTDQHRLKLAKRAKHNFMKKLVTEYKPKLRGKV